MVKPIRYYWNTVLFAITVLGKSISKISGEGK